MNRCVSQINAAVVVPAYRLAPIATWKDAFDPIVPVYKSHAGAHPEKKLVLMGDSAGDGLALALIEQFKQDGVRMPDELILMSPWVDVSMENPAIGAFANLDPWHTVWLLGPRARKWAGSCDLHDYQVSPIYGNLAGISNVTVFTGTKEIFLPDPLRLSAMLDQDCTNELIVGDGLMHMYPLMPIPEAEAAHKTTFEKVLR